MNQVVSKVFLFVLRRPPQGGCLAREALDQVLSAAAFDQVVQVLLLDDGVWQLLPEQQPNPGCEPVAPLFSALALYDVETPWVEQESLNERGLRVEDLVVPVRTLARREMSAWLAMHDVVVGC